MAGRFSQVVPSALYRYGDGVEAEAVEAEIEPEADDPEHGLDDLGVVVVEVGLVVEEAVPVVLLPRRGSKVQLDGSTSRKMTRTSA